LYHTPRRLAAVAAWLPVEDLRAALAASGRFSSANDVVNMMNLMKALELVKDP